MVDSKWARVFAQRRDLSGFVIKNEATQLYWCGSHTWVSTVTRARRFADNESAVARMCLMQTQEPNRDTKLVPVCVGGLL